VLALATTQELPRRKVGGKGDTGKISYGVWIISSGSEKALGFNSDWVLLCSGRTRPEAVDSWMLITQILH
jgi:hypothetical protein